MTDLPDFYGPMMRWPRVETIKHVPEVLAELHKTCMLALATNAVDSNAKQIWAALSRAELNHYLDKIYCFREIGYKKPSPEFFAYILNDLSLDPVNVVMVGDSFDSDVVGAVRYGLRAIWFNEHSNEVRETEIYQTIHDMRLLPKALESFHERV